MIHFTTKNNSYMLDNNILTRVDGLGAGDVFHLQDGYALPLVGERFAASRTDGGGYITTTVQSVTYQFITCPDCSGESNSDVDHNCGTCGCAGIIPNPEYTS